VSRSGVAKRNGVSYSRGSLWIGGWGDLEWTEAWDWGGIDPLREKELDDLKGASLDLQSSGGWLTGGWGGRTLGFSRTARAKR